MEAGKEKNRNRMASVFVEDGAFHFPVFCELKALVELNYSNRVKRAAPTRLHVEPLTD